MFPGVTVMGVPGANGTGGKCGAEERDTSFSERSGWKMLRLG